MSSRSGIRWLYGTLVLVVSQNLALVAGSFLVAGILFTAIEISLNTKRLGFRVVHRNVEGSLTMLGVDHVPVDQLNYIIPDLVLPCLVSTKKMGGTMKINMKYAIVTKFVGERRRLCRESKFAYLVSDKNKQKTYPLYEIEGHVGC